MVRVAHISDSHLGCSLFELAERREDVRKCFQKAVDMAMRLQPDILVHTGDVFHSPDPYHEDMVAAIEAFKDIEDQTKVFVLQGNHDLQYGFRRGICPVKMLESAGVARSTGDGVYARYKERFGREEVTVHLISWTTSRDVQRVVEDIKPQDGLNLLFSHDIPYDRELLPSHFDYIGIGHGHNFLLDEDSNVGRPGSTCIVDWRKEWDGKKKLILVECDTTTGNSYTTETLNDVREFRFVTGLDITGMGVEEVNQFLREQLDKISPKKKTHPIVIMQVGGLVDAETENSIRRVDLLRYGNKAVEPLFLHIEPRWQFLGPRPVKLVEPLNVRKSVIDYAQQTGQADITTMLQLLDQI